MNKPKFMQAALFAIGVSLLAISVEAATYTAVVPDGVSCRYPAIGQVDAIGDIHGDLAAFVTILKGRGWIDEAGHWAKGADTLVLTGDWLDRGPDSRAILDLIISLEKEAKNAGGQVVSIMGNHELMLLQGDVRYTTREEALAFSEFENHPNTRAIAEEYKIPLYKAAMVHALRHESPYAEWFAQKNVIAVVGRSLFVHAGLEAWIEQLSVEQVNSTFRTWIKHYQRGGPKPAQALDWIIDDGGPVWTRSFVTESIPETLLTEALRKNGADIAIAGHNVTKSGQIEFHYKQKVAIIDTGISSYYAGKLFAFNVSQGSASDRFNRAKDNAIAQTIRDRFAFGGCAKVARGF